MIRICPACRAPSNTFEPACWVCQRTFDGAEAVIGSVPYARRPLRSTRDEPHEYYAEESPERLARRNAG